MSYTRVICIVLLWSCINKEAILCFTIITYIWTASCDQLIHLNANVRVIPYYGMHWAYTASVHLISLTQKRHFSLLTAIAVKTWIHYRTKSLGVLRGSEHGIVIDWQNMTLIFQSAHFKKCSLAACRDYLNKHLWRCTQPREALNETRR